MTWTRLGIVLTGTIVGIALPQVLTAQTIAGWADDIKSLHTVLGEIYDEMLPKCDRLIGVGRGLAGFAALWFISSRVWGHLTRAESIDFYPLFRPFVIGVCILLFPSVIALINGVMQPVVLGTSAMVQESDTVIAVLLKQKEEAVKKSDHYLMYVGEDGAGDYDKWYRYTHDNEDPDEEGWMEAISNSVKFAMSKAYYNFRNAIKEVVAEILQLLFAAASLAINTMRTFNLIILAILGPLAFGLSVFDGFGHTLKHWLARYINVFLWLPIANIFGAVMGTIQENMLTIDIGQVAATGDTFFSRTDLGYLVFLVIGILGYFSVPSIANQILWVGGGDSITSRATAASMAAGGIAGNIAGGVASRAASGAKNIENSPNNIMEGFTGANTGSGKAAAIGTGIIKLGGYMHDKISGKSKE